MREAKLKSLIDEVNETKQMRKYFLLRGLAVNEMDKVLSRIES
jgi:hypothetical protein